MTDPQGLGNPARYLHVLEKPRYRVYPTVDGVLQYETVFSSGATNAAIIHVRYTVNAPNDAAAIERLKTNAHCDWLLRELPTNQPISQDDVSPITRVDMVAVCTGNTLPAASGYCVDVTGITAAEIAAAKIQFEFTPLRNVRDVFAMLSHGYGTGSTAITRLNLYGRVY